MLDVVRRIAATPPEVAQSTWFDTPSPKVRTTGPGRPRQEAYRLEGPRTLVRRLGERR